MKLSEMIAEANRERQKLIEMIIESDDSFDYNIQPRETLGYSLPAREPRVYESGIGGRIVSGR